MLDTISRNIRETIGVPYEIIASDNAESKLGICTVYNRAAANARFEYLCFVHEDVLFSTQSWGQNIIRHLHDKSIGLLGIAGGDTKSIIPSSWYIASKSNQIHLVQHYKYKKASPEYIRITDGSPNETARNVAAIDGVLLCTRKDVFEKFKFDESTFPGFHGYDIDYSLQVSTMYRLRVIFDVLIHHYSEGKPDKQWWESARNISEKWKTRLPISVHELSAKEFRDHHWATMQIFLQRMFTLGYPVRFIVFNFLKYSFIPSFFRIRRFGSMTKYLLTLYGQSK